MQAIAPLEREIPYTNGVLALYPAARLIAERCCVT